MIALADTSVPPDVNALLAAANTGLQAIPRDNLKTVIDESYTAVGGLGPELSRVVQGASTLAIDARKNLDPLTTLIDQAQPVLDSQTNTSDAIQAWASQLATVTAELQTHDEAVAGVIVKGGPAAAEVRQLVDRLQPTLPILMANLVSVGQVALTYQNNIEQLLVVFPQAIAAEQAGILGQPQHQTGLQRPIPELQPEPQPAATLHHGVSAGPATARCRVRGLSRRGRPVTCTAGSRRIRRSTCAVPATSRAKPCRESARRRSRCAKATKPYVPLNDGFNWKGDPNATLSGQPIPQLPPGACAAAAPAAPPPIAAAEYDPATGSYVGPDGRRYTQSDLAQGAPNDKTWQTMLLPPPGS